MKGWVKRFEPGRALSHAFPNEGQPMGVVDEPVQDGVGQGRVPDGLVPMLDRELTGDDGRASAMSVLEDLKQVASLG